MGLIGLIFDVVLGTRKKIKQHNAKNNTEATTVTVKNLYSIDVPNYLSSTSKASEDASLAYINKTLDISFVVIDEPKEEFAEAIKEMDKLSKEAGNSDDDANTDNYLLRKMAAISLSNMFEDMDKVELYDKTETTINGLPALTIDAFQKATFFKDGIYVSFGFIEGKDTLYQIVITTGGDSISKLSDKLPQYIRTFKEL